MSPLLRKPESSDPSFRSSSSLSGSSGYHSSSATSSKNENHRSPVDERKIVYVGRLEKDVTKQALGNKFAKFGRVAVTPILMSSKPYLT
ncbi:hypothetical protein PYW07_010213 [Mythimna separata]|uniref:RRM domain-containing protein n=1 Tax=Mythimna separata TaxID=271217 RepID=A0AAD7YIL8_MYTSE|nr:hypothetical protein PYW07_010213 [Mythimna separata]